MKKHVYNEAGSTHLVVVGILLASIFILFLFFDLFTGVMHKRVSQSGADAAALAAAEEIKSIYEEEIKDEMKDRLDYVREEADKRIEEYEEDNDKDDDGEHDDEDSDSEDEEEIEKLKYLFVLKEMFDKPIPEDLIEWLVDPDYEMDLNKILVFLFDKQEFNERVCRAINNEFNRVQLAARYYAGKNNAETDIEVEFPYGDEFEVYVKVYTEASFTTIDAGKMGEDRNVYAQAAAEIKRPAGIDIHCK